MEHHGLLRAHAHVIHASYDTGHHQLEPVALLPGSLQHNTIGNTNVSLKANAAAAMTGNGCVGVAIASTASFRC